ncbi:MAG: ATP-dependent DNA helicase PcrA, partial [Candidatus Actinomarinales bacterium]
NTDKDSLAFWSKKFQYIMVDEYQDTNYVQYKIIELLSRGHKNICVVGDSDQSIYAFRGADIRNIDEFDKDFSNAKTIVLDRNYRSTQKILDAANSVISCNKKRKSKNLWSEKIEGPEINSIKFSNENDETRWIVQEIKENIEDKSYGEVAIFYRMNSQSRILQEALTRERVPYKVIGDVRFYERKEIKDIIAYLALISNPDNEIAFERIINVPKRGIGNATIEKLRITAGELGIPLSQLVYRIEEVDNLTERVQKQLSNFQEVLVAIKTEAINGPVQAISSMLEVTKYEETLKQEVDYDNRWENVQSLITGASEFELEVEEEILDKDDPYSLLTAYIENLALFSATDELGDDNNIVLMTLHNAKGLEFDTVFITGMEENIFPHELSFDDVEEERRLCYVGMTRAKERLFLTHSWARSSWGGTFYNPPSRFLEEAKECVNSVDHTDYSSYENKTKTIEGISIGKDVTHKAYGRGRIIEVDGTEVTIDFGEENGIKHFDTEWAPLEFE